MPVAKIHLLEGQYARRGSTKCRTRSNRRSLAIDMADAIFTHPLLAEGLNTLFAMFIRRSEFPTPQGREFGR